MHADQPEWILRAQQAIGRRVQAARMDANLTQEKLAERTGISRTTVQSIEAGRNDPKMSHLLLIARAVDVSIHDLIP
ncbi:helix-turn-helix domain-containing protein [Streptomyces sp. NPDC093595]|uniref:helix-turn-helix domain-containing protein n=1 Tax=Streptomyces sp. NPDC093595 TaxID=3366045 RepID=UPI0038003575